MLTSWRPFSRDELGRTLQHEDTTPKLHNTCDSLLAQVDLAAGAGEDGLLFQVLLGDLRTELGDLLLQVRTPARARHQRQQRSARERGSWSGSPLPSAEGRCGWRGAPALVLGPVPDPGLALRGELLLREEEALHVWRSSLHGGGWGRARGEGWRQWRRGTSWQFGREGAPAPRWCSAGSRAAGWRARRSARQWLVRTWCGRVRTSQRPDVWESARACVVCVGVVSRGWADWDAWQNG